MISVHLIKVKSSCNCSLFSVHQNLFCKNQSLSQSLIIFYILNAVETLLQKNDTKRWHVLFKLRDGWSYFFNQKPPRILKREKSKNLLIFTEKRGLINFNLQTCSRAHARNGDLNEVPKKQVAYQGSSDYTRGTVWHDVHTHHTIRLRHEMRISMSLDRYIDYLS